MITLAHKNIHKLQKHKMTHTGEKAHKCYQCLPCVHAPSFKIHMRTHMGEMSYKCSQCKYTCTRVTNLHTHMLTHTEVRAFNCDQCNKYSHEKVIFILLPNNSGVITSDRICKPGQLADYMVGPRNISSLCKCLMKLISFPHSYAE